MLSSTWLLWFKLSIFKVVHIVVYTSTTPPFHFFLIKFYIISHFLFLPPHSIKYPPLLSLNFMLSFHSVLLAAYKYTDTFLNVILLSLHSVTCLNIFKADKLIFFSLGKTIPPSLNIPYLPVLFFYVWLRLFIFCYVGVQCGIYPLISLQTTELFLCFAYY